MNKETYYCSNCFNDFDVDVTAICEAVNNIKEFKSSPYSSISMQVSCPHCKELATFLVDEKMIPIIRNLNKNGYLTNAHCSGHLERTPFHFKSTEPSSAYISIDVSMRQIKKIKQILVPGNLEVIYTTGKESFMIIDEEKRRPDILRRYSVDIYYTLNLQTEEDIDKAMETIFNYVNQFPKSRRFRKGMFISAIMEED